jgi:uncharacterized protein (TIGR03790 family)
MALSKRLWALSFMIIVAAKAWAGGSGLNVIVVVNQNSTNSVQLGNDYCEQRGVPPQNFLRMTGWTNSAIEWAPNDFQTLLLKPLLALVLARGLTNQSQYILLSMDIPYRIADPTGQNGTTSALFYGFKTNTPPPLPPECIPVSCSLPDDSFNSYAFSELPFAEAPPDTAVTNSFLAMMLTASNLTTAELILSRGVASDSTFPTQSVYLEKTSDSARSVRWTEFDNALMDGRIRENSSLVWINSDSTSFTSVFGLLTGFPNLSLPPNAFVSGAIADTLTSYAGELFEDSSQMSLLVFLNAGAAGSYGTVVEPCNYLQKFPDPLDYFYQSRGFCLAEAYYQSVLNPYQGVMVGEPLSAPFAHPGAADWGTLTNGAVLGGTVTLSPTFAAAATNLALGRVDLFVDGTFVQTMTNVPPSAGNQLSVVLNNITTHYTVTSNSTVASVATDLASALNAQTNATQVQAWAMGDRIELQSLQVAVLGGNVSLSANSAAVSAAPLTTWLTQVRPTFLDTSATGYAGVLVSNAPTTGDWLQVQFTKTNSTQVTIAVTNPPGNTSIAMLTSSLVNAVNANPSLRGPDGLRALDFGDDTFCGIISAQFTLYARSPGWPASQIQVAFAASPDLLVLPSGTNMLQDNLNDLRPRNHLYVSSGVTALPVSFAFDSTRFPDGWHHLTAVAYEGDSVRTQTPVSRSARIQNTALTATFTPSVAGTNVLINTPLQFTITASVGNISRTELFSTGGSLGVVSNQQTAIFTAPSAILGVGLHPFYALVTDTAGRRYQTQTAWIRLVPPVLPFSLSISPSPLTLFWTAVPGQRYQVLATTNIISSFQPVASVTATTSVSQWPISAPGGPTAFYRVQVSP